MKRTDLTQSGEGEGRVNWDSSTETYTLPCTKQVANGKLPYNTGSSTLYSVRTYRGGMRWGMREVQEGGDICILMADSLCCMTETNTTFWSHYPPIKNKLKKKKKDDSGNSHCRQFSPETSVWREASVRSSREDVELRFCFALKKGEITGCLFADGKDPQRRLDHRSPILGDKSPPPRLLVSGCTFQLICWI